jgi:AraC-like DNA-binding protein
MDVIANEVGFFDRDRMRHAFLRILGQPPQAIRRVGKESRVAPEMPDDSGIDVPSPRPDA